MAFRNGRILRDPYPADLPLDILILAEGAGKLIVTHSSAESGAYITWTKGASENQGRLANRNSPAWNNSAAALPWRQQTSCERCGLAGEFGNTYSREGVRHLLCALMTGRYWTEWIQLPGHS